MIKDIFNILCVESILNVREIKLHRRIIGHVHDHFIQLIIYLLKLNLLTYYR